MADASNMFIIKEKQIGVIKNLKSYWTALPTLKLNL